ncbi:MAG: hypothetical protein H0W61_06535 [Bacteroidetes bacterium]|nr:hypothetical protein [Bacteroidota bacterium]
MIKLKKIISQLDSEIYRAIEKTLVKNKSENFLCLLQSYRENLNDEQVIKKLNLNSNSFYVLKSRLYHKIQQELSGDIHDNREGLLKKLNLVTGMCLSEPRDVAVAFLKKLEEDLLKYDMHNELLIVYSALKKVHLYSEKYFQYSQLYNKHIAFGLCLEKAEEILGNFNRMLGQYNFSRVPKIIETLLFMRKEVNDHFSLNPSRQVEIVKNFLELQLCIFCHTDLNKEINAEELLHHTHKLIEELPESSCQKKWVPALEHLYFEYYYKTGNTKAATTFYEKVNSGISTLFLYSNISCTSRFLISKLGFLELQGKEKELVGGDRKNILFDVNDMHTKVLMGMYDSMAEVYSKNFKESANKLNKLLNENSFKDYFHINTDIKISLAYTYILLHEYDMADSILKGVYRKIKAEKITNYAHVLDLLKVLEADVRKRGGPLSSKQKDSITLFMARNKGETQILSHLQGALAKNYS